MSSSEVRERGGSQTWRWVTVVLVVLVVALGGLVARNVVARASAGDGSMPHNAAMEAQLGIRVSRVAVVGDGGLITLSYLAIDPEKATKFQYDRDHPPRLVSEARKGGTQRVSLMRQGHTMRAGQTYYFVYQNTGGAIRPHELVTVEYGDFRLEHVPVL